MSEAKTTKRSWGTIIRWVGTVLALALMVYLLSQRWEEIWEGAQKIGVARFLITLVLMSGSRLMMAVRWHVLLQDPALYDGQLPPSFLTSLRLTFAGLFGNNFLPSTIGGDVVRLAGATRAGISGAVAAASLVVDRLVGMTGMALALPFAISHFLAYEGDLNFQFGSRPSYWVSLSVVTEESRLNKLLSKAKELIQKVWQAVKLWSKSPQVLFLSLLATLTHMTFLFGTLWVALDAMGEPLSCWTIAGLWSVVYFITLIPISINGYGVLELITVFAFSTLAGVSEPASLALAILYRTLMMVTSLPGAFFVSGLLSKE